MISAGNCAVHVFASIKDVGRRRGVSTKKHLHPPLLVEGMLEIRPLLMDAQVYTKKKKYQGCVSLIRDLKRGKRFFSFSFFLFIILN